MQRKRQTSNAESVTVVTLEGLCQVKGGLSVRYRINTRGKPLVCTRQYININS